jgi:hypothetical protein
MWMLHRVNFKVRYILVVLPLHIKFHIVEFSKKRKLHSLIKPP